MSFSFSPNIVNDNSLVIYVDAQNPKCGGVGTTKLLNLGRPELPSGSESTIFKDWNSTNGATIATSSYGNVLEFDGTDDYWTPVNSPVKRLPKDFTYSTWINIDRNPPGTMGTTIFWGGSGASIERAWLLIAGNNIQVRMSSDLGVLSTSINTYFTSSYPNPFNHITVTGQDNGDSTTTVSFYINGSQVTSSIHAIVQNRTSSVNNYQEPRIGRGGSASSSYFAGEIAMIQVYTRTLFADEVARNYNTTKTRFGL